MSKNKKKLLLLFMLSNSRKKTVISMSYPDAEYWFGFETGQERLCLFSTLGSDLPIKRQVSVH